MGHAGTLDPSATGVLPVCLGKGTRLMEFLVDTTKTYRAEVELGTATDTYDGEGTVTQKEDPSGITQEQLEATLNAFRGNIRQTPPMYSAVKHKGQPLYKLARAGISVARKSRPVKIHRLELTGWQPPLLTLEIECSKGTYIRSLAHDLGQALGCGAYLKGLVRTRCGSFAIEDAVELPRLEEAFRYGYWPHFLHPIDTVLQHYGAVVVNEATEAIIKNGGSLTLEAFQENGVSGQNRCRAYSLDGRFLAVLHRLPENGRWQPKKVLI